MATIGDVARLAGVSRSTVSYALSGNRTISTETRERIADAIRALGFTPNAGARALATSKTKLIGLFVQFLEEEFAPAMMQYVIPISDAAREAGFDILLATEPDGPAALRRLGESNMVDGVVLLNAVDPDPRVPVLRELGKPGSIVGLPGDVDGIDVFDLDFVSAAEAAVDHLHALGHREILLVSPHRAVFRGGGAYSWRFRDAAVGRAGVLGIRIDVVSGDSHQPEVGHQLAALLSRDPTPSGWIIHNDAVVAALPAVLSDRGIAVPRDLSVIGVFSEQFARTFSLPFTAVESSPERLGRLAVRAVVAGIADPTHSPSVHLLPPTLVDRGSTRRIDRAS